jgi:hypothetical protein
VLFDELLEHKSLLLGEFGRSHGDHGGTFHQARWIAAKVALIHRLPTEPTQCGKRFATSSRRAASALKGNRIPTHRCLGHEAQVERCSSWLRSQPGHKVAHRSQIARVSRQPEVMVTMLAELETSMS